MLKLRHLLFLFFIPSTFCAYSQNKELSRSQIKDSVQKISAIIVDFYQRDLDSGLIYCKKLEQFVTHYRDTAGLIEAESMKAEYFWRKSDYESAAIPALEAVKIADKYGKDSIRKARAIQTYATVQLYLLNSKNAIKYYKQALKIYRDAGSTTSVASMLNNIGVSFSDLQKEKKEPYGFDSAEIYFKKVLSMEGDVKAGTRGNSISNLSEIYYIRGEYKKALTLWEGWLAKHPEANTTTFKSMSYGTIAQLHHKLGNDEEAMRYYKEGLGSARSLGANYDVSAYYKSISDFYKDQGDYKKALNYNEKWALLSDSVFNIEKSKTISELSKKYETEKINRQNAQLKNEVAVKELEAENERQKLYFVAAATILALILLGLTIRLFLISKKSNKLLDKKNKQLTDLSNTKDHLFSIISHDLKSPLSAFHTITSSITQNWEHLSKDDVKSYIESLKDSSKEVHNMMDNLLKWALTQTGQLPYKPKNLYPEEVIKKVKDQLSVALQAKKIEWKEDFKSTEQLKADEEYLQIIIRNLVSNAIKFSKLNSEIELAVQTDESNNIITIKDKGVGMKPEDIKRLFDGNSVHLIKNSQDKGTGLGLTLCKSLMEKMNGTIEVQSQYLKGTSFKLIFPKAA